jgi:SSS family solute:Na+ symporter
MIPYFLGIGAFVYFTTQGGILADAFIVTNEDGETAVNSLYALPVFLSHILPIGLLGLIVAAMIAAFMSTHDSYLLCWSSVITLDVIAPLRGETMTEKAKILSMRIIIVIIGLYILFWGLFYEPSDDLWDYLGISGAIYFTGAISVLTFGLYWKRASSTGAALALLSGFVAILGLGKFRSALFPEWIGPAEFGLMSLALSFLCMIVGSILVPDPPSDTQAPLAA